MNIPIVSVIMPAFNAEKTIRSAIESVINQSLKQWELIVINDGSSDTTVNIVTEYSRIDSRISLLNLSINGGLANARNQGCLSAKGNFIAFLDSDDLWLSEKLQVQVAFHQKYPSIEISHTNFIAFNNKGLIKRPFKWSIEPVKNKQGDIYPSVCYKNPIGVLTVMASSRLLKEVGYFDVSLWGMEDHDLWVRIAQAGYQFGYLSKVFAHYRYTSSSMTSKVGKCKRSYKTLIRKIIAIGDLNKALLYRQYYRHFGTVYFKKKSFSLARLYFLKSIQITPLDMVAISSILYLLYSEATRVRTKVFSQT